MESLLNLNFLNLFCLLGCTGYVELRKFSSTITYIRNCSIKQFDYVKYNGYEILTTNSISYELLLVSGSGEPWLRSEKYAELGTEILLPCILKSLQCEGLHSIKWYQRSTRILIFSEDTGIIRGDSDIATR